jgi:lipid-A-disaccharide synthase-like uncharacterized protein
MSLRRPSLKSTAYMLLLAAGIVLVIALVFRGAGAPEEPARTVLPGAADLTLPEAGRYLVLAEQVVRPNPSTASHRDDPQPKIELTELLPGNIRGPQITIEAPSRLDWLYKVMVGGSGRTRGHFHLSRPGTYRIEGVEKAEGGGAGKASVVLALVHTASPGRFLWLALGFGGQICFSMRFLIQWLASERAGRSTIPRAFWYYSLVGGLMVLTYAAYTRDPVFGTWCSSVARTGGPGTVAHESPSPKHTTRNTQRSTRNGGRFAAET